MDIRKAFGWIKSLGLAEKYNPYHYPKGHPLAGKFAPKGVAGSATTVPYRGTRVHQKLVKQGLVKPWEKKKHKKEEFKLVHDETGRRIYQLTDQDMKKYATPLDREQHMEARTPSTHKDREGTAKQKARYSLRRMQASIEATASGPEYGKGLGQGRLDRLFDVKYVPKGESKSFNIGYYRGYTENPGNYREHAARNPNYQGLSIHNPALPQYKKAKP